MDPPDAEPANPTHPPAAAATRCPHPPGRSERSREVPAGSSVSTPSTPVPVLRVPQGCRGGAACARSAERCEAPLRQGHWGAHIMARRRTGVLSAARGGAELGRTDRRRVSERHAAQRSLRLAVRALPAGGSAARPAGWGHGARFVMHVAVVHAAPRLSRRGLSGKALCQRGGYSCVEKICSCHMYMCAPSTHSSKGCGSAPSPSAASRSARADRHENGGRVRG